MRERQEKNGLTVNVIAGTHVVFFGLDLSPEQRAGFRGFGFKRFDAVTGETIWLRGMKTFKKTEPFPAKGETFSTRDHPIQSFQWCDFNRGSVATQEYARRFQNEPPSKAGRGAYEWLSRGLLETLTTPSARR